MGVSFVIVYHEILFFSSVHVGDHSFHRITTGVHLQLSHKGSGNKIFFSILEFSHGTIVPRKYVELGGSKWN